MSAQTISSRARVVSTRMCVEMVCADMRAYAPDCIVADSMAVWGKAVAKKLGISRSYVSRIEKRALQKLEEALGERE